MLCPTGAMEDIFPMLPQWMLLPSYRTTLTALVIVVGTAMTYAYITLARLIKPMLFDDAVSNDSEDNKLIDKKSK